MDSVGEDSPKSEPVRGSHLSTPGGADPNQCGVT